jgi:hypothetical protein
MAGLFIFWRACCCGMPMRPLAILLICAVGWLPLAAPAVNAPADARPASGQSLRAAHQELRDKLDRSPFHQPIYLVAEEEDHHLKGDVYAVLKHPFADASRAFADPAQWCEILLLPFNTKHCEAAGGASGRGALTLLLGRKHTTPIEKTHRLEFGFAVAARGADYLRVMLSAPQGPFSTRDYEVVLEMIPLGERRSFMHMSYRYGYGNLARAAMRAYLATIGAHKVGFTVEAAQEGQGALVRGMRGVMERNTMRYYLAIEAYLRAMGLPPEHRAAKMVDDWFAAIERYPRQLRELSRDEYVAMKREEFRRMHARISPAPRTASSSP